MKIKVENQTVWKYHFFGWGNAIDAIQTLHNNYGIKFIGYLDDIAAFEKIKEPFIGFFHHAPNSPKNQYYANLKGLKHYLDSPYWKENEKRCKGIYTLSRYTQQFIQERTNCPVESLWLPIPDKINCFSWNQYQENKNKLLVNPGNWLRNFESFNGLKTNKSKAITKPWKKISQHHPDYDSSISCLQYMSWHEYDALLSNNIVFQCYHDVVASNTILECIGKNTPLIVNRLPAAEEYLGKDYPLFYSSLEEASIISDDEDLLFSGHTYLKGMNKTKFNKKEFLMSLTSGDIYKNLKVVFL